MNLGVWHRTRIEPHIDKITLALHGLAALRNEYDIVNIRTMQVDLVVVLLRHIAGHETVVLQRVTLHESSLHSLLDLVVEFLYRTDADLLAILVAPDGKRRSPET